MLARPVPLADTGAAGVGQHGRTKRFEVSQQAVPFNRGPDLLRARCDQQPGLERETLGLGFPGDGSCPGDIFIRRIGAAADQGCADLQGPTLAPGFGPKGAYFTGKVRCMGPVDVGRQGGQIDLDDLVIVGSRIGQHFVIGTQVMGDRIGGFGSAFSAGALKVAGHGLVIGKDRSGGSDLCPHVAYGGLSGGADAPRARTDVLHDGTGTALYGQDLGYLQNDVLWRRPAAQFACQVHADQLREPHIPGKPGHDVDGIGTANPNGYHAQAAGIRGVGICTDHHPAGKGVILQHDLMDDATTRLPETGSVLGRDGFQEMIHFLIGVDGPEQIPFGRNLGLDQVVAMGGGRHPDFGKPGRIELKPGHLGRRVLHRYAVRPEVHVADPAFHLGIG